MIELEDEPPTALETSSRYLATPHHKNELDLGRELVLAFVAQELPGEYDRCADFFRRRGAYGRFKGYLESRDVLENGMPLRTKPRRTGCVRGVKSTAFR
ncbi:hypothetical protein H010_23731 [Hydrogenophaga taeniospiralis CCUG 15921]|uniref:Uncharacterized protein n=1 Tax=Hydrogenophaga taeniospiralis CCUG 15921 TaxID=1281780 RepID=A0A9X4NVV0_9BURK|nr:hypothetical protein [Hydrogenophaga taeniospiralis]MDG5978282.1 hypothetical protein [Hydrogenophaga taeniospiralis CCUG 15921]